MTFFMYHPVFKLNLFNVTEVSFGTELRQDVSLLSIITSSVLHSYEQLIQMNQAFWFTFSLSFFYVCFGSFFVLTLVSVYLFGFGE